MPWGFGLWLWCSGHGSGRNLELVVVACWSVGGHGFFWNGFGAHERMGMEALDFKNLLLGLGFFVLGLMWEDYGMKKKKKKGMKMKNVEDELMSFLLWYFLYWICSEKMN